LFLLLALQTVSPETAQHMQAGVDAHKQGRFDAAAEEFRKATESDPTLTDAFLDLGEVCLELRDYAAATKALTRALELSPDLDAAHLQLGYALLAQGYAEMAIPHLERVHASEALGIARIETGQYQQAIADLSAALAQRPGDPDRAGLHRVLLRIEGDVARRADEDGEAQREVSGAPEALAHGAICGCIVPRVDGQKTPRVFRVAQQDRAAITRIPAKELGPRP